MNKKDFIITAVIAVLSVALITTIIVFKKNDKTNTPNTPSSTVAHDHNGDGVADHDDSYHATGNGALNEDTDIDVDVEDLPTGGSNNSGNSGNSNGNSNGAVDGDEIDMDDLINAGKN